MAKSTTSRPEHGVEALAKALKVSPFVARKRLRAAKVKKSGRYYDFKTAAGVAKVAKDLSA